MYQVQLLTDVILKSKQHEKFNLKIQKHIILGSVNLSYSLFPYDNTIPSQIILTN